MSFVVLFFQNICDAVAAKAAASNRPGAYEWILNRYLPSSLAENISFFKFAVCGKEFPQQIMYNIFGGEYNESSQNRKIYC